MLCSAKLRWAEVNCVILCCAVVCRVVPCFAAVSRCGFYCAVRCCVIMCLVVQKKRTHSLASPPRYSLAIHPAPFSHFYSLSLILNPQPLRIHPSLSSHRYPLSLFPFPPPIVHLHDICSLFVGCRTTLTSTRRWELMIPGRATFGWCIRWLTGIFWKISPNEQK